MSARCVRCGAQPQVASSTCPSCGGNVLMVIDGAARLPRARPVSAWRQVDRSDVDALLRTYQEATERRRNERSLHQHRGDDPPTFDVSDWATPPEVLGLITRAFAVEHQVLPIQKVGPRLIVAVVDDEDLELVERVHVHTGLVVGVVSAAPDDLRAAIARHYPPSSGTQEP